MEPLSYLPGLKASALGWIFVFATLTAFELLNPREQQPLRARLHAIGYWAALVPLYFGLSALLRVALDNLGVEPFFTLSFDETGWWGSIAAGIAGALFGAMVHDFFFYWYHRAQHRWLWRWHSVHHSVEHLNALNSYHHISEPLMSMVMLQLPLALVFADTSPAIPIATTLLGLHVVWIHSPTRATLGPLRAILVDNRYHRIHHSLEERHFDRNFGAFTTIWDRLFGTEHMPASDEWPAVGLADQAQPAGLRSWLNLPRKDRDRGTRLQPDALSRP